MINCKLKEILEAAKGKLLSGDPEIEVPGISTDTRTIKKSELFLALKGKNFDGHNFIDEAVKKQALGVIVNLKVEELKSLKVENLAVIKVEDTLKAYGDIAHDYRMRFNSSFVAVTGSNGKTTTKEMIARIVSARFTVLKNEGTENNLVGLPKTLLKLRPKHEVGVLELGTNHPGEIKRLSQILMPRIGLVTNIAPTHLEFLKTPQTVFKEKMELMNSIGKNGVSILNADDEFLSKVKSTTLKQIRFGITNRCDYRASEISQERDGMRFVLNNKHDFRIKLFGKHNIYNALAAIAVAFSYRIDYPEIHKVLLELKPWKGRMNLKSAGEVDVIDDTYNSNPGSLAAALKVFSEYKTLSKKIFVCGDMLELGSASVKYHSEIGKLIANSGIDWLITVGNFRDVVKETAVLNGMHAEKAVSCDDKNAVLELLKRLVKEKALVLVKGSRLMKLEEVVDALLSFISPKGDMVRI